MWASCRARSTGHKLRGLRDALRASKSSKPSPETKQRILRTLDKPPPPGQPNWTGRLLVTALGDVSEKSVWQALRGIARRRELERAQRLATVGQLAAGVAHEFNNLLAAMSGRAELARASGDQEQYEKLADTVLQRTERGAEICRNLTQFARPQEPKREPMQVQRAVDSALSMAARQIANADVVVDRDYQTQRGAIHADAGQLEQVFLNLIINACHAMPEGGVLTVRTRCASDEAGGQQIMASVSDSGYGIAPEDLPRIFEPFFTTKGRLGKNGTPGTGLGLSVSHGIVVANEGTIDVASEDGVGTTFNLRFPACERDVTEKERPADAPVVVVRESKKGRMLLAEDEEAVRDVLMDILVTRGHEVVTAASAPEAISAMATMDVDLIITDLVMPGGGGYEVLSAASELADPPPLLVITGRGEAHVAEEMAALGARRCLQKPMRLADVIAAIDEMLVERD